MDSTIEEFTKASNPQHESIDEVLHSANLVNQLEMAKSVNLLRIYDRPIKKIAKQYENDYDGLNIYLDDQAIVWTIV